MRNENRIIWLVYYCFILWFIDIQFVYFRSKKFILYIPWYWHWLITLLQITNMKIIFFFCHNFHDILKFSIQFFGISLSKILNFPKKKKILMKILFQIIYTIVSYIDFIKDFIFDGFVMLLKKIVIFISGNVTF